MKKNEPKIPDNAVVLLIGIAGTGKTTLAKRVFGDTSVIVSSDQCRKEISGSEQDQSVNQEAFKLFYKKIEEGILNEKRVIADATNLEKFSREKIYKIARRHIVTIYALVFNFPIEMIKEQNEGRNRYVPDYAIDKMYEKMKIAYKQIKWEISPKNIIDIIPSQEQIKDIEETR